MKGENRKKKLHPKEIQMQIQIQIQEADLKHLEGKTTRLNPPKRNTNIINCHQNISENAMDLLLH